MLIGAKNFLDKFKGNRNLNIYRLMLFAEMPNTFDERIHTAITGIFVFICRTRPADTTGPTIVEKEILETIR